MAALCPCNRCGSCLAVTVVCGRSWIGERSSSSSSIRSRPADELHRCRNLIDQGARARLCDDLLRSNGFPPLWTRRWPPHVGCTRSSLALTIKAPSSSTQRASKPIGIARPRNPNSGCHFRRPAPPRSNLCLTSTRRRRCFLRRTSGPCKETGVARVSWPSLNRTWRDPSVGTFASAPFGPPRPLYREDGVDVPDLSPCFNLSSS